MMIGFGPARHQARDVAADDGLAEDHAAQNVADGAVRRLPHLLEVELLDARLVWRNGGALHAHAMLLNGVRGVDGYLVAGCVAVLDAKIVIVQIDIEIWLDKLVFDERPDDTGHFVAIEFDDGILDFDLSHGNLRGR